MASGHSSGKDAGATRAEHTRVSQVRSRVIFEREMGHTARPIQYDRTSVLLLGWCPKLDDTGVAEELDDLEEVFRDKYRFNVQKELLHASSHPQNQAFKHLSHFVDAEDGPRTLLIVYYAGHGWSEGVGSGRISLGGRAPCNKKEEDAFSIEWVDVEKTLAKTSADVLVIFDCCNAGLICRRANRGRSRCYQYLGACETTHTTSSAGPQSFTHAMTWALKEFATIPGFLLTELVDKIQLCPTFPTDQTPVLFLSRFGASMEIIYIAPNPPENVLDADAPPSPPASMSASPSLQPSDILATQDVLDLRFHFAEPATESDIKELARSMRRILDDRDPAWHRVSFLDRQSIAERVAEKWKGTVKRHSPSKVAVPVQVTEQTLAAGPVATAKMGDRLQLPRLDTAQGGSSSTFTSAAVTPSPNDQMPYEGVEIVFQSPGVVRERLNRDSGADPAGRQAALWDRCLIAFGILVGSRRPPAAWHPSSWI